MSDKEVKKYISDNRYYAVFNAVCDNFPFLAENYRDENNTVVFAEMFMQIFAYDKDFAIEVWQLYL